MSVRMLFIGLIVALATSARAGAAVSGPSVLCTPEDLPPFAAGGPASVQAAAPANGLRIVIPGLTRIEDPPLPPPEPPPPPPGPGSALLALQDRLVAAVDGFGQPGVFAVAVTDLQTGHTVGAGLDRVQPAGCITNLFVIIAALRDVDAGRYPLADVDATIRQTIWASDATAAYGLYRIVGGGDVVAGVRVVSDLMGVTLGMESSLIDHPPAFVGDSLGVADTNYVTARDVNRALAKVYRGEVLSAELTAYLLEAMTNVKPGLNYLTAIVPPPAVVSHKNGFFWAPEGYVDNDTSIVRFGPGLPYAYALTFLSAAVPVKYADIPLGQELVRESWAYFEGAYE